MDMNSAEAAQSLEAMRVSREKLAAAAGCPPERHAAFALALGALVASQAAPVWGVFATEAVVLAAIPLVILWDRRRTGMFINGYRNGRTRPLTFAMLGFALALGALGVWLKLAHGVWWAPLPCGAAVAAGAWWASSRWMRIYRRELSETP